MAARASALTTLEGAHSGVLIDFMQTGHVVHDGEFLYIYNSPHTAKVLAVADPHRRGELLAYVGALCVSSSSSC